MNIIVYLCRMNMRNIIYLFAILLTQTACDGTKVSEKLDQIDSLIAREQIDSACVLLKEVAGASMIEEDQAHYGLLATQLGYLSNDPLSSDSLLDLALIYYNKVGNCQKLADAYYYKSARSRINQDYPQAILYCKEAERLADQSKDLYLKYKILENLAYLNGLCENDLLQLQYAQKALRTAQIVQNKKWMANSYINISFSFANLGQYDSVYYYIEKSIPLLNNVYDSNKAEFLTNVGLFFKEENPEKAKEYFEKAIEFNELPITLEHLADIYYAEGNKGKAYNLWKKALVTSGGVGYEKDNLIHSILSYDLERGKLDEASANLDRVISIKDSIINVLRNDTIKDLQLRFDHEVAMRQQDQVTANWQKGVLAAVILVILLAAYILVRKGIEKIKMQEKQMQINDHVSHIRELEASGENAKEEIERLNKEIKKLTDEESPKLKQGRMLYDQIKDGKPIKDWTIKEKRLFINYYKAIDYRTVSRIKKVKRRGPLTEHSLLYLILMEMYNQDEDKVIKILSISDNGMRTLKSRTRPVD